MTQRPCVFVSYSHKDELWKDRLVEHLRVLELEGDLDIWDDRRIEAGDDWRPEIEQAIAVAELAVLIVSKNFLNSKFIRQEELVRILERRAQRELRVIPLIAEPCAWQAVRALQGIQARPKDGQALSRGNDHEINEELSALALEIRSALHGKGTDVSSPAAGRVANPASRRPSSLRRLAWLCLPTVLLIAGAVASTCWRVPTRIAVDLITSRVTFDVRRDGLELLGDTPGFSRLVIENCGVASFEAAEFTLVESEEPRVAPTTGPYAGPVRLQCPDPDAKITLEPSADAPVKLGALDRLALFNGTTAVLEVSGHSTPVLTIDLSTARELNFPIYRELLLTADLVETEPAFRQDTALATFRTRLNDKNSWFHLQTSDRRTTLVITPTAESAVSFFSERTRIPVEVPQFFQETSDGLLPAFLADGVLRYPDYPDILPITVKGDDFLLLRQTTGMEISRLGLWQERPGLEMTVEGRVAEAAIGQPEAGAAPEERTGQWLDPRLTVYQVVRFGTLWNLVAAVAAWAAATTWTWHERWKRF